MVDFDRRELVWAVDAADYWVPRVDAVHHRLLQTAWPGFRIRHLPCDLNLLAEAAGADDHVEYLPDDRRPATIHEANGGETLSGLEVYFDVQEDADDLDPRDSPPEDSSSETGRNFSDGDARAWITLIENDGAVRHRHLEKIPLDLLRADPSAIQRLRGLPPSEIPPERRVIEGMWIDLSERNIGLWGG